MRGDVPGCLCLEVSLSKRGALRQWWLIVAPKSLIFPALALAAFLAWKAAWAIGPRMVRRRESDG